MSAPSTEKVTVFLRIKPILDEKVCFCRSLWSHLVPHIGVKKWLELKPILVLVCIWLIPLINSAQIIIALITTCTNLIIQKSPQTSLKNNSNNKLFQKPQKQTNRPPSKKSTTAPSSLFPHHPKPTLTQLSSNSITFLMVKRPSRRSLIALHMVLSANSSPGAKPYCSHTVWHHQVKHILFKGPTTTAVCYLVQFKPF